MRLEAALHSGVLVDRNPRVEAVDQEDLGAVELMVSSTDAIERKIDTMSIMTHRGQQ